MATEKTYEDDFNEMFGPKKEKKEEQVPQDTDNNDDNQAQGELFNKEEDKQQDNDKKVDATSDKSKEDTEVDYDSLLNTVPEEAREQVRLLIQKDKSHKGRLSAQDRELNQLRERYQNVLRNNEQLQQQYAQGNQHSPAAADEKPNKEDKGREKTPEMSAELRAIKEKHPKLYKAFEEMSAAKAQEVAEAMNQDVARKLKPVEEAQRTATYKEEAARLDKMAASLFDKESTGLDVTKVVQSDEFADWFRGQPLSIQNIYRNAENADEAMMVLSKFSVESSYIEEARNKNKANSKPEKQEPPVPNLNKGDDIRKRREVTKKAAVAPDNKEAPTGSDAPVDYESLFDHYWGKNGIHRTQRSNTRL